MACNAGGLLPVVALLPPRNSPASWLHGRGIMTSKRDPRRPGPRKLLSSTAWEFAVHICGTTFKLIKYNRVYGMYVII